MKEVHRLKILKKISDLGIENWHEISGSDRYEDILSIPEDYPIKTYPDGWAEKVFNNNLFDFQKDLSDVAICFLNNCMKGNEDISNVNKEILNSIGLDSRFGVYYTLGTWRINRECELFIGNMILSGCETKEIYNHAIIFQHDGAVKKYEHHAFIAEILTKFNFAKCENSISVMEDYSNAEMEIVRCFSDCGYQNVRLCHIPEADKIIDILKKYSVKLTNDYWKKLLAKYWLFKGDFAELEVFFKYYDENRLEQDAGLTEEAYTNILCGYRFAETNLPATLMHFICSHNKQGFLKRIKKLGACTTCCYKSVLEYEPFLRLVNINELSEEDIVKLMGTFSSEYDSKIDIMYELAKEQGRILTPKEFFYLCEKPDWKIRLYFALSMSIDESLIRVREVPDEVCMLMEEKVDILAKALKEKRFSEYVKHYAYISNLDKTDIVRILLNQECLNSVINEIKSVDDLDFVLYNKELTGTLAARRNTYIETEENAMFLSKLGVSKEDAIPFVLDNSFNIAKTYYENSREEQRDNVVKIAKAAILGKLDVLKYADFEKEIGAYIPEIMKESWKNNTEKQFSKYFVKEYTDFKSVMSIGEVPVQTCQSYKSGYYNECLLSNFDANKKIVYVSKDGEIVGRAILRFTKASDSGTNSELCFMDVTNQTADTADSSELCLFLEKPYIKKGTHGNEVIAIRKLLKQFAKEKADTMTLPLYCNALYEGEHIDKYIYISRSKNGQQYLDSLIGDCGVRNENQFYRTIVCI